MSGPKRILMGHCQTHGRPDQYHSLCAGHIRSQFGVEYECSCPAHSFADNDPVSDNGRAKSDPALRQQPGSWPNSQGESDVTQSTRNNPPGNTPEVDA